MAREGRRGRRARHRRRHVDGGAARALRRPRSRRGSRATSRTSSRRSSRARRLSPADLQAANPNLHHGDPYSGSLALDQNFLWRPFPGRPGPPHAGRPALAHRREHLARARASARAPGRSSRRSCCRPRRRAAAPSGSPPAELCLPAAGALWEDRRVARLRRRSPSMSTSLETTAVRSAPRFSISQISTLPASFDDDLAAYAAAGLDGIGIWELKLPAGRRRRRARSRRSSGAGSSPRRRCRACRRSCRCRCSAGRPIRPERIDALCASIHRLAALRRARDRLPDRHRALGLDPDRARADRRRRAAHARRRGRARRRRGSRSSRTRRRRRRVDDREHDPRGGRADRRGGRPPVARAAVRHLAPLEHADRCSTTSAARSTGSPASTSRTCAARRAAGPTACCPATASPTCRPLIARARRGRLGRALRPGDLLRQRHVRHRTTQIRSGTFPPPSSLAVAAPRCSRRGRAVRRLAPVDQTTQRQGG